jgi:GNAT superfamily N-acetyltransferase
MKVQSQRLKEELAIREFDHEIDDIVSLTHLLNVAYKQLADMGLNYVATHQGPEITLKRIANATCFVLLKQNQIVGTISYYKPGMKSGTEWYQRPNVSVVGQFGVLPEYQKYGYGTLLLNRAIEEARRDGADELALDTAEQATHLHRFYMKQGFRMVGNADWKETNYKSVVMSKRLKK